MLKVVFDTNILISSMIFKGSEVEKIYNLAKERKFRLYLSEYILEEFVKVCTEKLGLEKNLVLKHIQRLKKIAYLTEPKLKVHIIKEKDDDNRILECAMEAKADYLVTGDKKHLLPLKKFKKTKIVSPKEFIKALKEYEKRERRFGK